MKIIIKAKREEEEEEEEEGEGLVMRTNKSLHRNFIDFNVDE
jgi:hypothetical protein